MPITPTIVNDFNRPDALSLGPNWAPTTPGGARLQILNNSAYNPSTIRDEFWVPDKFGPDLEVQTDLGAALGTGTIRLGARMRSEFPLDVPPDEWTGTGWAVNKGYLASFSGSAVSLIVRDTAGDVTVLGSTVAALPTAGGAVALRCEGTTITALTRFDATSPWETQVIATDDTFNEHGYTTLGLAGGVLAEGFSGGSEEPPPPVATRASWGIIAR